MPRETWRPARQHLASERLVRELRARGVSEADTEVDYYLGVRDLSEEPWSYYWHGQTDNGVVGDLRRVQAHEADCSPFLWISGTRWMFYHQGLQQPAPHCWAAEGGGGIPERMLRGRGLT